MKRKWAKMTTKNGILKRIRWNIFDDKRNKNDVIFLSIRIHIESVTADVVVLSRGDECADWKKKGKTESILFPSWIHCIPLTSNFVHRLPYTESRMHSSFETKNLLLCVLCHLPAKGHKYCNISILFCILCCAILSKRMDGCVQLKLNFFPKQ